MANFNTHIAVGATVSGIAATACMGANIAPSNDVLIYFSLGTLGSVLPDLDSDNSVLLQIIFHILSVFFAFTIMFKLAGDYSLVESMLIWFLCYLGIQVGVFNIFKRFTVHRGIFHSIPAGALAWLLVTFITYQIVGFSPLRAWMAGFFVFIGYITHLVLDELYSVDINNKKIKKSFGSALKLADLSNIPGSIAIYVAVLSMLLITPTQQPFMNTVFNKKTYSVMKENLLPKNGNWFFLP